MTAFVLLTFIFFGLLLPNSEVLRVQNLEPLRQKALIDSELDESPKTQHTFLSIATQVLPTKQAVSKSTNYDNTQTANTTDTEASELGSLAKKKQENIQLESNTKKQLMTNDLKLLDLKEKENQLRIKAESDRIALKDSIIDFEEKVADLISKSSKVIDAVRKETAHTFLDPNYLPHFIDNDVNGCPTLCDPFKCDEYPAKETHCMFLREDKDEGGHVKMTRVCKPFLNPEKHECPDKFARCSSIVPEVSLTFNGEFNKENQKPITIEIPGHNLHKCIRIAFLNPETLCSPQNIETIMTESLRFTGGSANLTNPNIIHNNETKLSVAKFENLAIRLPGTYDVCILEYAFNKAGETLALSAQVVGELNLVDSAEKMTSLNFSKSQTSNKTIDKASSQSDIEPSTDLEKS